MLHTTLFQTFAACANFLTAQELTAETPEGASFDLAAAAAMIPAHGDSSTGSELKAVEEVCRGLLERSNHANSVDVRKNRHSPFDALRTNG